MQSQMHCHVHLLQLLSPYSTDVEQLVKAQNKCRELQAIQNLPTCSLSPQKLRNLSPEGLPGWCDASLSHQWLFLPNSLWWVTLDKLHCMSRPGTHFSQALIGVHYIWLHTKRDMAQLTKQGIPCQAAKVRQHSRVPVQPITVPETTFSYVHVDSHFLLPLLHGFQYLLTAINCSTWWHEAFPLVGIKAEEHVQAFAHGRVACYCVPLHLTSDCGRHFTSTFWNHLVPTVGMQNQWTTSNHPQATGLIEHFYHSLRPKKDLQPSLPSLSFWHQSLFPSCLISTFLPFEVQIPSIPQHHCTRHPCGLPFTLTSSSCLSELMHINLQWNAPNKSHFKCSHLLIKCLSLTSTAK